MLTPVNMFFDRVGAFSCGNTLSVDENSAISYTISANKKAVVLMNVGSKPIWAGGSDVDPISSKGIKMLPMEKWIWRNCESTFKIYFKCAASDVSLVGVVETD